MRVAVSTARGADEVGGGQSGVIFAACAFLLSFLVTFQVCSLDGLLSLSVSSRHDHSYQLPSCLDQFQSIYFLLSSIVRVELL